MSRGSFDRKILAESSVVISMSTIRNIPYDSVENSIEPFAQEDCGLEMLVWDPLAQQHLKVTRREPRKRQI